MNPDFPAWLRQALLNNRGRPPGDLVKRRVPNPYTGEPLTRAEVAETLGIDEEALDLVQSVQSGIYQLDLSHEGNDWVVTVAGPGGRKALRVGPDYQAAVQAFENLKRSYR